MKFAKKFISGQRTAEEYSMTVQEFKQIEKNWMDDNLPDVDYHSACQEIALYINVNYSGEYFYFGGAVPSLDSDHAVRSAIGLDTLI